MPQKKQPLQKLELTWIGKGTEPKLEPRILISDPEHSYGSKRNENLLIHGDNLLALKALEQEYTGKVKCIYIDPPYNTGNAFEHYDDGLEHSIWLNLMYERLKLLRKLLRNDGFICVHIDDSEGDYLKVIMDEIFGRDNFLTTFYVRVRYPDKTLKSDMNFHKEIERVKIYRKDYGATPNLNQVPITDEKYIYFFKELKKGEEITLGGKKTIIFKKGEYEIYQDEASVSGRKEIWASGTILDGNSSGRFFRDYLDGRVNIDGLGALYKVFKIGEESSGFRYFTGPNREGATKGKYFQGMPQSQSEGDQKFKNIPISNFYDLAGSFGNCRNEGGVDFRSGKKPEALLNIILGHFSDPGDLVLDSFLGSGTTAAVAHKMGRRWIGIELGEHAITHCVPRLKKVIDGEDSGGITKAVDWSGGGGYTFYRLAPSLLNLDGHGNYIISKEYNPDMLAAAMAKHEGFRYNPDPAIYWKQGSTTGLDFIFTTTQLVTVQMIESIQEEMKPGETLLICCKTFQKECKGKFSNITIKKIPQVLIGKCEFGKEDYSLNIIESPRLESDQDEQDITELSVQEIPKKTKKAKEQRSLFDL
jgi:adenine-specific DNA-methyltransferase